MDEDYTTELIQGDCINVMSEMDENSVHAVITDSPYGLNFMGKTWDEFEPKEYQTQLDWDREKRGLL